jgi:hypothetical protein
MRCTDPSIEHVGGRPSGGSILIHQHDVSMFLSTVGAYCGVMATSDFPAPVGSGQWVGRDLLDEWDGVAGRLHRLVNHRQQLCGQASKSTCWRSRALNA